MVPHVHVQVICTDQSHSRTGQDIATFQRDDSTGLGSWAAIRGGPGFRINVLDSGEALRDASEETQGFPAPLESKGPGRVRVNLRCTRRCGQSLTARAEKLVPVLNRLAEHALMIKSADDPDDLRSAMGGRGVHIEITLEELRAILASN